MKKHEKLAHDLRELITQKPFKPKEVFLSIREVATLYHVGINTAYTALQTLEDEGILLAEKRSGYVISDVSKKTINPDGFRFSGEEELSHRANLIRKWAENSKQAKIRMDLATGEPDTYPVRDLQAICYKLIRSNPAVLTNYALGSGFYDLRRKISNRYHKLGCKIHPDDILITNGATQALTLALQSTTANGDWVLVESPTYFGFLQIAESLKLNVVSVPIDAQEGLGLEQVESVIAKCKAENKQIKVCLLQANYQNPTGSTIKQNVRARMLEAFYQNGIVVIEDDTFSELSHDTDGRPEPLKSKDKYNNVILCSSLSKLISPGLRVGFIQGAAYHERVRTLHHATAIGCAEIPQQMISHIYPKRFEAILKPMIESYQAKYMTVREHVLRCFPEGTSVPIAGGGYLLWINLPVGINANRLFDLALSQYGISFAPGSLFAMNTNHHNAMRVNCSAYESTFHQEDIEHLGQIAHSLLNTSRA